MPSTNASIAASLAEIAELLQLQDANPYRIQAYRAAAQAVRAMAPDFARQAALGKGTCSRGIGVPMLAKIEALARTGSCDRLLELRRAVPAGWRALLQVRGLGPKRARRLAQALALRTPVQLRRACRQGAVRAVPGFGPATEAKILAALEGGAIEAPPTTRADAKQQLTPLLRYLSRCPAAERVVVAGSYRRERAMVGDLDLLVGAHDSPAVVKAFSDYPGFQRIDSRGAVRATAFLPSGLQVDLRVIAPTALGAALVYFTGSRSHTIELRRLAKARGLRLNEYGLFRGRVRIAGATEQSVYRALGLRWVRPQRRESAASIAPR